jgi:glycosyltransferase involved in cell wall biosynthesis
LINYSVVIPNKNNFLLLERCLASIPDRNDLEVIIVDDCSDETQFNLDNYPGKDRNSVEIIFTKENNGAGFARNQGIQNARGEWIIFSDSDDCFCNDFLKYTDKYLGTKYDIVYFASVIIELLKEKKLKNGDFRNNLIDSYIRREEGSLKKIKFMHTTPWGKLYKKDFIIKNKILFEEVVAGNDLLFCVKASHNAINIAADQNKMYTYFRNNIDSTTYSKNYDVINARYLALLRLNQFLVKIGEENYKRLILNNFFKVSFFGLKETILAIKQLYMHDSSFLKEIKVLMKIIIERIKSNIFVRLN